MQRFYCSLATLSHRKLVGLCKVFSAPETLLNHFSTESCSCLRNETQASLLVSNPRNLSSDFSPFFPELSLGWITIEGSTFPALQYLVNLCSHLAFLHCPTWRFVSIQNLGLGNRERKVCSYYSHIFPSWWYVHRTSFSSLLNFRPQKLKTQELTPVYSYHCLMPSLRHWTPSWWAFTIIQGKAMG